jgi:putative PEP-CTERM system TPR-repeat lipoprotein
LTNIAPSNRKPLPAMRKALLASCVALLSLGLTACGQKADADLLASAQDLLAKKDSKGAVIQLKNVLQKSPDSAPARFLLGKTLLEGGDPVAALVELRKAQELQTPDAQVIPEIARAMLLVGDAGKLIAQYGQTQLKEDIPAADLKTALAAAYAVQGDMEASRNAAAEALRIKPGFAPALTVQARLIAADGDADGALRTLEQVLTADAGNERAGMLKGEILLRGKHDIDAALAAFRKAAAAHPDSVGAHAATANILFQQKKTAETKVELEQLKKIAPNHPETLYVEAQVAFSERDYKLTRDIGERILKVMPNNVPVLELAGAAEYRLKSYVQAEALLGRALKAAPKQVVTRQLLAQTYLRTGQPDKAVEILQPLVDAPQADGTSLALLGEAHLQQGDGKRSDAAFQRALKAAPEDSRVRTSAAVAQIARGNSSGAITELETLAGGEGNPRADLALISAKLRQNDLAGALKAIDTLEKKLPDQALPQNLRGRVLLLKRDVPGATLSFQAALAKDPTYFPAVASLAAIDLSTGKPDEARKRFEALLKAQPKSYQAKLALAELEARIGSPPATVMALLREAAKLNPSEPVPHLTLVNRLIADGDVKGALAAAQDATAALPNNLDVMDALGRAQMVAGDQQRAVSTFKKLASLQPKQALPEVRLADAYIAIGDTAAANASLRHAVELEPGLLLARRAQARLAVLDKRPQDALLIARDLQQRNPKDPAGFALEAEIESSRKNWDAAATAHRAALARAKTSDTAAKLHNALRGAGKQAEADRVAADWLKENPKDAAFRYYQGDAALSQNEYAIAEGHYRAVLEIQPNNALALNNVAWLMVKQGKPGAVAVAERANALLPERAPLMDTLSTALEAENQLPKAVEMQKRAIALSPQDPLLALRLAKLFIKQGDKPRARAELEALAKLGDKFIAQPEVATLLKSL